MLARQHRRRRLIRHRGAYPGDLVGGDAHPDAGAANQHPQILFAGGHAATDRLGVIRVIRRFRRVDTQIGERHAALGEIRLQGLLQRIPGVIRAQDQAKWLGDGGRFLEVAGGLVHEFQERGDPLLDLIAAAAIDLVGTADRIRNVFLVRLQRVVKLPQQKGLLRRLGIQQDDGVHVPAGHPEYQRGLAHQFRRQHLTPDLADLDAQFLHHPDRVRARRLAVHGAHSRRFDLDARPVRQRPTRQSFGHGAAAHVPRAYK